MNNTIANRTFKPIVSCRKSLDAFEDIFRSFAFDTINEHFGSSVHLIV